MAGVLLRALLEAVGQAGDTGDDAPLLSSFDWPAHGVRVPYVVFFTGRCGSTWFTSLIKKTGLVGNPDEFLNHELARVRAARRTYETLADYFADVVTGESQNGYFGVQVDAQRLEQMKPAIDLHGVFPSEQTRSFFMYRRDILAQAWSWAAARKSGLWHVRPGKEVTRVEKAPLPTPDDLVREVVQLRRAEEFLRGYFKSNGYDPVFLEYETLVADPVSVLQLLLVSLGVSGDDCRQINVESGGDTSRLTYDEKHAVLLEFHQRYPDFAKVIGRERLTISSEALQEMFASV